MGTVNVRNLELIREREGRAGGWTPGALLLAALAGAALFGAALMAWQERAPTPPPREDPLASLVEAERAVAPTKAPAPAVLSSKEATFGTVLSDASEAPTAYVAAVAPPPSGAPKSPPQPEAVPEAPAVPPAPVPEVLAPLGVVPIPAAAVMLVSDVTVAPADPLLATATTLSEPEDSVAAPGANGGYQLQAAAYDNRADAERFAKALRARGHRAHVIEGVVKDKRWHRVRVGPFETREEALRERAVLVQKEQLRPFLVNTKDES